MKKIILMGVLLGCLGGGLATVAQANEIERTSGFFANSTSGVRTFSTGFIDPDGNYAYFVGYFSPSKMLRVTLKDDEGSTITPIADEVLTLGNVNVEGTLIAPTGNDAYAFTNQSQVLKIDLSSFTVAETLSGVALKTPVMHPSGQYIYGLSTSPGLSVRTIQLGDSMDLIGTGLSLPDDGTSYAISAIDSEGQYAYFVTYKQHTEGSFPSQITVLDEQNIVVVRVGDEMGNPLSAPERVASVSIGVDYRVKSIAISPDDTMLYVITAGEVLPFKLKENGNRLDTPQAPASENILEIALTDSSGSTTKFPSKISPDGKFLYFGNQNSSVTNLFKIKLKEGSSTLDKPEIVDTLNGLSEGENGQVGVLLLDPNGSRLHLGIYSSSGPIVTIATNEMVSLAHTITYDANGGSNAPASVQQDVDADITIATAGEMVRTGYVLSSWNSASDGSGTSYELGVTASFEGDTTLYAQWTLNTYTITYDANGGTGNIGAQVENFFQEAVLANGDGFTRTYYVFSGWNTSVDGSGTAYASGLSDVFNTMTLYAQWEDNSYTLSYLANGGEGSIEDQREVVGDAATLSNGSGITRNHYIFTGWNDASDGTGNPYSPSSSYLGATVSLYAQWTPNTYTITFDSNDGSTVEDAVATYNTVIQLATPTREGYGFNRWNSSATFDGVGYGGGDDYSVIANATLYAEWSTSNYVVSFDTDGGSEIDYIIYAFGDTILTPPVPTKNGYTFAGWDVELPETMPATDYLLTAQWTPNTYTITFDSNGGSAVEDAVATYNTVMQLATPTREGYGFNRWNSSETFDGVGYGGGDDYSVIANATLYAEWSTSNYVVSFDTDGGSEIDYIIYAFGDTILTPPVPTKTGYTFAGWDVELPEIMPATDYLLTAQWTPNTYQLTFDSTGGLVQINDEAMEIGTINATYAAEIVVPTATRSGYTFSAWSPSVPETMTLTQNTTFEAQWVTNNYTLSFNTNGGAEMESVSYLFQQFIETPNTPVRTGYTFSGWSPEVPESMGASNLTVTAQWAINTYTITFDADGGSAVSSQTVTYNQAVGTLPTSNKTAYRLTGWRIGQSETVNSETLMPAENITLSAIWVEKDYSNISIPTDMDEGEEAVTDETVVQPSQTFVVPVNAKLTTQSFGGTGSVENNGTIDTNELVVGGSFTNHGVIETRSVIQVSSGGSLVNNANSHLIIHHTPSSLSSHAVTAQDINVGTVIVDGTLTVILEDELPEQAKYTITLFEGSIEGEFDTINLPELPSGYFWDSSELYSLGVLHVVGSDSGLVNRPLNYPNPFKWSSGTYIGYQLNGAHDTELRVYTLRGQEIFRKQFVANVDEGAKAGYNKVQITSSTTSDAWSAGVYPYLLMQDGKIIGRGRMVVIP